MWPKGVYDTGQSAYRVQLNLSGAMRKFSRNVKSFEEVGGVDLRTYFHDHVRTHDVP